MRREEMVERGARAEWEEAWPTGPEWETWEQVAPDTKAQWRNGVRAILDAILPQVSTVEELEALPVGTVVVAPSGAAWELRPPSTWYGLNGWQMTARHLLTGRSPLTVVWQP